MKEGNDGSGLKPSADAARPQTLSDAVTIAGNTPAWFLVYKDADGNRNIRGYGFHPDEMAGIALTLQFQAYGFMGMKDVSEASPASPAEASGAGTNTPR